MPVPEKAGPGPIAIIVAAVVLLVLFGLLVYLAWREGNPKPKQVPQGTSGRQTLTIRCSQAQFFTGVAVELL
jgi:hypothetical protein